MPRLWLIGGPSGVGKSTLGARIVEDNWDAVGPFAADDFFTEQTMTGARYRFDPTRLPEAHKQCQQNVEYAMLSEDKPDIVVTNTFTQQWEREPYLALAQKHGYEVCVVMMDLVTATDEDLAQRNTHGVSAQVIGKMRQRIAQRI